MLTPIGIEAPVWCAVTPGCNLAANSFSQTLNFATTKPRLMMAMDVLIQARKVRSLARYSVARRSDTGVAWSVMRFVGWPLRG